jgi:hypothetical protein
MDGFSVLPFVEYVIMLTRIKTGSYAAATAAAIIRCHNVHQDEENFTKWVVLSGT